MKLSSYTLGLAMLVALSACSTSKADKIDADKKEAETKKDQPLPICPQVAIIRDLDDMKDFGTEKPDPAELVSQARMLNVTGECEYKDNGIDVRFDLNFAAAKGPRLGGLRVSFPYFIAVVAPDKTILNKDKMTVEFSFSSDKKTIEHAESLHVFIPLPKAQRSFGPDYQVLSGFQLDEDQVKMIRGGAKP